MTLYQEKLKRRWKKVNEVKLLKKFSPDCIIKKYLITEKTNDLVEKFNKYVFYVARWANKNDVRKSINILFGVTPIKLNISKSPEKTRVRRWLVKRAMTKAIVSLKKWDKIDVGLKPTTTKKA